MTVAKDKTETTEAQQPGQPKARRKLVGNPEAVAMQEIADHLEPLPLAGRRRVLAWVNDVYGVPKNMPADNGGE